MQVGDQRIELMAAVNDTATDVTQARSIVGEALRDAGGDIYGAAMKVVEVDPASGQPVSVYASSTFKTLTATAAGASTVWDPAGGKRFALQGFTISVCGTLAVAGVQTLSLSDSSGGVIWEGAAFVSDTLAGDSQLAAGFSPGYLAQTTAGNLVITLGTAMASGGVVVSAWGAEV